MNLKDLFGQRPKQINLFGWIKRIRQSSSSNRLYSKQTSRSYLTYNRGWMREPRSLSQPNLKINLR